MDNIVNRHAHGKLLAVIINLAHVYCCIAQPLGPPNTVAGMEICDKTENIYLTIS